ncbi:MAG TPA: butyrate kinase, partial [Candidatus Aminicenantes bacterium]|nr:butyrate kinase [Candidatus Aminicenantes bacterium]
MRLLILNPGSTSTKIAVYEGDREIFSENIAHSAEQVGRYKRMVDQKDFRKEIILKTLAGRGIDPKSFAAVIGRGGLLKPIPSGTYEVN